MSPRVELGVDNVGKFSLKPGDGDLGLVEIYGEEDGTMDFKKLPA